MPTDADSCSPTPKPQARMQAPKKPATGQLGLLFWFFLTCFQVSQVKDCLLDVLTTEASEPERTGPTTSNPPETLRVASTRPAATLRTPGEGKGPECGLEN